MQQRHRTFDAPRHQVAVRRLAVGERNSRLRCPADMFTPRASASTSSGCAYSRSIRSRTPQAREVAQVLRCGGSAGHLRDRATSHGSCPAAVPSHPTPKLLTCRHGAGGAQQISMRIAPGAPPPGRLAGTGLWQQACRDRRSVDLAGRLHRRTQRRPVESSRRRRCRAVRLDDRRAGTQSANRWFCPPDASKPIIEEWITQGGASPRASDVRHRARQVIHRCADLRRHS